VLCTWPETAQKFISDRGSSGVRKKITKQIKNRLICIDVFIQFLRKPIGEIIFKNIYLVLLVVPDSSDKVGEILVEHTFQVSLHLPQGHG
jgi:hypothetical protein